MLGLGFISVRPGSYVLRAETAAVAGLAIIQATLEDWLLFITLYLFTPC